jgi:beta-lactamase superfamily II metal-dependent hydrolase
MVRLLLVLLLAGARLGAQETRIIMFDVGQGDGALVITPEGRRILIDAGTSSTPISRYLAATGNDTLDLVIASHAHSDHIGGMPDILRSFVVRNYLDNGVPHTTQTYRTTMQLVRAEGSRYLAAEPRTLTVGSLSVRVLSNPPGELDQNNESVGVVIEFGRFRALFTGDSEVEELGHWLAADSLPRMTVVKLAHHGSSNGTTPAWARRLRPRVALVSVGEGNSYGHPSPAAIRSWCAAGSRVYRTDQSGSLLVRALRDGRTTVERLEPGSPPRRPVNACAAGR